MAFHKPSWPTVRIPVAAAMLHILGAILGILGAILDGLVFIADICGVIRFFRWLRE